MREDYLRMPEEEQDEWDRKVTKVDKAMLFILGCDSDEMQKNVVQQTMLADEQYPCDI